MMTDPLQALLGIKASHLVAGLLGGAVRAVVVPGLNIYQAIMSTIVGAVVAGYFTPIVPPIAVRLGYEDIVRSGGEGAISFLLGLTGMVVTEGIIVAAKNWWAKFKLPK